MKQSSKETNPNTENHSSTITSLVVALYGFVAFYAFKIDITNCVVFWSISAIVIFLYIAICISISTYSSLTSSKTNIAIIIFFMLALSMMTAVFIYAFAHKTFFKFEDSITVSYKNGKEEFMCKNMQCSGATFTRNGKKYKVEIQSVVLQKQSTAPIT